VSVTNSYLRVTRVFDSLGPDTDRRCQSTVQERLILLSQMFRTGDAPLAAGVSRLLQRQSPT